MIIDEKWINVHLEEHQSIDDEPEVRDLRNQGWVVANALLSLGRPQRQRVVSVRLLLADDD